jgi:hypothetical protein
MEAFVLAFQLFALFWFFGGLLLFSWVYSFRLKRFAKRTATQTRELAKKSVINTKSFFHLMSQTCFMLSAFLIPIAVTIICLFFG